MRTIAERAKEYAPDAFDPDYILPAREGYIVSLQRRAYIAGAEEQKRIDIDKACEWLKEKPTNRKSLVCKDWKLKHY